MAYLIFMSAARGVSGPVRAAAFLQKRFSVRPALALILGSGFQPVTARLQAVQRLPYAKIPGFPVPTVPGHAGEFCLGQLGGVTVAVLSGRAHFYEGHGLEQVTFAVRTLAALGIRDLVLTNAAGGINPRFRPGDFMALTDHINFMGVNPLRGPTPPGQARFVDLTETYDDGLRSLLLKSGKKAGLKLRQGVYLAVSGPSYETPAEIRAFATLGADAVGMSTVPEAIVARQFGLRVAAVSCITNPAAGLGAAKLSHTEVLETAARVQTSGAALLEAFAKIYGSEFVNRH